LRYSHAAVTIGLVTASLIALAGWAGAGCMLLGYALLSTNRIQAGPAFQTLNLNGAFGLLLNGATHRAWPSVAVNVIWLLITVATLVQQRKRTAGTAPVHFAPPRTGVRRPRTGGQPRYRLHHRDPAAVARTAAGNRHQNPSFLVAHADLPHIRSRA
jgi:hypothetical protein